jgi:hypothetical protein
MKKLIYGVLYVLAGIAWTYLTVTVIASEDDLLVNLIIFILFTIPGIIMVINGLMRIKRYLVNKRKLANAPVRFKPLDFSKAEAKDFTPEEIEAFTEDEQIAFANNAVITRWEVIGREWDAFKERKCTPKAINQQALFGSFFFGIGVGGFLMLVFYNRPLVTMLEAGVIGAVLTGAFVFSFLRKSAYNTYGFANESDAGQFTFTTSSIIFNGSKTVLNDDHRHVSSARVIVKNNFHYLFIIVPDSRILRMSTNLYEFPVPDDKIKEAELLASLYN